MFVVADLELVSHCSVLETNVMKLVINDSCAADVVS